MCDSWAIVKQTDFASLPPPTALPSPRPRPQWTNFDTRLFLNSFKRIFEQATSSFVVITKVTRSSKSVTWHDIQSGIFKSSSSRVFSLIGLKSVHQDESGSLPKSPGFHLHRDPAPDHRPHLPVQLHQGRQLPPAVRSRRFPSTGPDQPGLDYGPHGSVAPPQDPHVRSHWDPLEVTFRNPAGWQL